MIKIIDAKFLLGTKIIPRMLFLLIIYLFISVQQNAQLYVKCVNVRSKKDSRVHSGKQQQKAKRKTNRPHRNSEGM